MIKPHALTWASIIGDDIIRDSNNALPKGWKMESKYMRSLVSRQRLIQTAAWFSRNLLDTKYTYIYTYAQVEMILTMRNVTNKITRTESFRVVAWVCRNVTTYFSIVTFLLLPFTFSFLTETGPSALGWKTTARHCKIWCMTRGLVRRVLANRLAITSAAQRNNDITRNDIVPVAVVACLAVCINIPRNKSLLPVQYVKYASVRLRYVQDIHEAWWERERKKEKEKMVKLGRTVSKKPNLIRIFFPCEKTSEKLAKLSDDF